MNFDLELAELERRHLLLRRVVWALVPCSVVTLALAAIFYPGPFGAGYRFGNIQLHLDLLGYFTRQGIEHSLFEDKMVLGVRMGAVQGVINIIKLALIVTGVGSLLRLQPRWALGCGLLWYGLASLSESWVDHSGYSVAGPLEFGIHRVGPSPDSMIQPPAPSDALPTFSDMSRKLGGSAVSIARIHADIEEKARQREQRALQMRAVMEYPQGFSPYQAAALHYTAAQIGYLEENEPMVERHLSAIPTGQFNATWDSDYRLRIMQEWLVKNGGTLAASAYRPTTGMSLTLSRLIAALFAALGGIALVTMVLCVHWRRGLARRQERMQALSLEIEVAPAPRTAPIPSRFGRRVNPVSALATNSSARQR